MKIRVYDISWDTDGMEVDDLPEEVIIDEPTEEMIEDIDGYADEVADYLSDEYGWCVGNFCTELMEIE